MPVTSSFQTIDVWKQGGSRPLPSSMPQAFRIEGALHKPHPPAPIGQAPHPRAALILLQLAHEIDKLISAEGLALKVDIDGLLLHRSDRRGTALCCRRASDARLSR